MSKVSEPQNLPRIVAQILVLNEDQDQSLPAEMHLNARSPVFSDADRDFILQLADGAVDATPAENWGEVESTNSIPKDRAAVNFECAYGQELRQSEIIKLRDDFSRYVSFELWPQTSLSALDGVTPAKAARNPDAHLPVCAAINVLSVFAEEHGFALDIDLLRTQLGLPPIQSSPVVDAKDVAVIPVTEAIRLPFAELTPEALINAFPVVGSSNQAYPFRRIIDVMYERKIFPPEIPLLRFCQIAQTQAMKVLAMDDALLWINRGREALPSLKDKERMQGQIQLDYDELFHAAITGNLGRLTELLRLFSRQYFSQMPEIKEQIWALLESERIDSREIMSIMNGTDFSLVGATSGGTTPGGLWTPDAVEAAPGGGKLWVPGQE